MSIDEDGNVYHIVLDADNVNSDGHSFTFDINSSEKITTDADGNALEILPLPPTSHVGTHQGIAYIQVINIHTIFKICLKKSILRLVKTGFTQQG